MKQYAEKQRNNNGVLLPDDCECPDCHHIDLSKPGVREYFATRPDIDISGSWPWMCDCRGQEERRKAELLSASNLPHRLDPRTFENFKPVIGTDKALQAAQAFCSGEGPHILVLVGEAGCGKSHLVEAIGRHFIAKGKSARYEHVSELLDELRGSYDSASQQSAWDILERCDRAHVLLLDEVGLAKNTPWTIEHVTTMVDGRYRNTRLLVVATNKPYAEMMENEANFRLASRLYDEHSGDVSVVYITAPDYRRG